MPSKFFLGETSLLECISDSSAASFRLCIRPLRAVDSCVFVELEMDLSFVKAITCGLEFIVVVLGNMHVCVFDYCGVELWRIVDLPVLSVSVFGNENVCIVTESFVAVYKIGKLLCRLETFSNPHGLLSVSAEKLVCLGLQRGTLRVYKSDLRPANSIAAHTSSLEALALGGENLHVATISETGTLVRIHDIGGIQLAEIRIWDQHVRRLVIGLVDGAFVVAVLGKRILTVYPYTKPSLTEPGLIQSLISKLTPNSHKYTVPANDDAVIHLNSFFVLSGFRLEEYLGPKLIHTWVNDEWTVLDEEEVHRTCLSDT